MKKDKFNRNKRIIFLLVLFITINIIIISRLFYLQIVKSNEISKMALKQINRSEELISDRGLIYDRNGKKLAINVSASSVFFNPQFIEKGSDLHEVKSSLINELAPILNIDKDTMSELVNADKRTKLMQWVDRETSMKIRSMEFEGIEIVDGFRRFYPYGNMASHLIGFTNSENVGQYGIEAFFNDELSGSPGRLLKSSDRLNRQLPNGEIDRFDADDGLSLILTIDQSIQKMVDEESKNIIKNFDADSVEIIIQEVKTGDILAMSTYPAFDNNQPRTAISDSQKRVWEEMTSEEIQNEWYRNWINPMTSDIYEPGSTFKLITLAAALEENTTNANKHYYCTGYIRDIKNAPPLKCVSYKDPHGDISLADALAKSCNPSFVYMNRDLGREKFLKYINTFGFGRKTNITLPNEEWGIIPRNAESISELSFATMSYGHGIAVTPLQLINAVSAIGNNGNLMTPRVVKEMIDTNGIVVNTVEIEEKRQVISYETSQEILGMMEQAVESGTGTKAKSGLYRIGGKTGTANKINPQGGYTDDEYISSFVGLAPIDNPQISILIKVDNPKGEIYGSLVAAPSAKLLLEKTLEYLKVPSIEEGTINTDKTEVPDVEYMMLEDAGKVISDLGLKYTTEYVNITDKTIVLSQKPAPGELVEPGTIIELSIDQNNREELIIPKLIGKSIDESMKILDILGLKYKIEGNEGVVINQDPLYSEMIEKNGEIILTIGDIEELGANESNDQNFKDGLLQEERFIEDDNLNKEENED